MRGGKTEGKMPGPLFPRLHVNDTDKGGPKPPPRNKMALYEQLSIPSQRFTDAPASMLPLPPVYGGTLANTDSSNQGHGLEKCRFPPFQTSAASYHSNVKQGSFSTDGLSHERSKGNSIKRSMPTTHTGELNDVTHLKWPSRQKNEAEFKAQSLSRPAVNSDSSYNQSNLNKEKYMGGSSSLRLHPLQPDVKRLEISTSPDQESEGNFKALNEGSLKLCEPGQRHDKYISSLPQASQENSKNVTMIVNARDNVSPAISLLPITGEEHSERSSQVPTSSNSQQKSSAVNAGVLRFDPGLEARLSYNHSGLLNSVQNDLRHEDENESSALPASVLNRNDDPTSNAFALGRVSCAFISPDDVVEMIGDKHFWKVRRAIINGEEQFALCILTEPFLEAIHGEIAP